MKVFPEVNFHKGNSIHSPVEHEDKFEIIDVSIAFWRNKIIVMIKAMII